MNPTRVIQPTNFYAQPVYRDFLIPGFLLEDETAIHGRLDAPDWIPTGGCKAYEFISSDAVLIEAVKARP